MDRLLPNVITRDLTKAKSSRKGAVPALIVIHTTQGIMDLRARSEFWDSTVGTGRDSSSHVGVGHVSKRQGESSARYVVDDDKAWTQAFFNPVALSIEIEGFSEAKSWDDGTVREVARWVAHWSIHTGIPIRFGIVVGSAVVRSGVLGHRRLGILGGGHSDPGTFPMRRMLRTAKKIKKQRLAEGVK